MVASLLERKGRSVGKRRLDYIHLHERKMNGQGSGHLLHAVFVIRQDTYAHLVFKKESFELI